MSTAPVGPDYQYGQIIANLRAELRRRNLTQEQAAELVGLSQPALSRRLNGGDFPFSEVVRMCNELGITFDDLTRYVPPQRVKTHGSPRPKDEGDRGVVAGAGFEPATSGL